MKELSIEEKAKRYDEAIEIAMKFLNKELFAENSEWAIKHIFPELKESEDEKIRKDLITFLDDILHLGKKANFNKWDKADCSDWIAWLEKRRQTFTKKDVGDAYLKGVCDAKHELEKQGEQKIVWSEDDEEMLNQVIEDVVKLAGPHVCYYKDINWLKSLKDKAQSNQGEMSKMCPTSVQDKI